MITHPFSIFEPFAKRFDVRFFTKEDNVQTDEDLAEKIGDSNIASLWQVHGGKTTTARGRTSRTEQADAIATAEINLWLSIRAADCQQFVVYAPEQHVCAVIHAGWKGLKAGAIPGAFTHLKQEWGIDAKNTYVGIGPSLCTACAEFTDPATELAGLDPTFFHGRNADLQGISDHQLDLLGIPATHRERHPACTQCESDLYWTYRGGEREKITSGYRNVIACVLR